MTARTRLVGQTGDSKLLAGFKKNWPANQAIPLAGTVYQPAAVVTLLQSRVDASTAVEASNAVWRNDVKKEVDLKAKTQAEVAALKQIVLAMFGTSIATLAEFGLAPRKPRTVSPETSVGAAAKSRATRVARHTAGSVQKSKIHGAPATPAPAASTTPATPAPVAAPAQVTTAPGPAPVAASPAPVTNAGLAPHT